MGAVDLVNDDYFVEASDVTNIAIGINIAVLDEVTIDSIASIGSVVEKIVQLNELGIVV